MKFEIDALSLGNIVDRARRACPRRAVVQTEGMIKIVANNSKVSACGAEPNIFIEASSIANVIEGGSTLVSPADILNTTKYAAEGDIIVAELLPRSLKLDFKGTVKIPIAEPSDFIGIESRDPVKWITRLGKQELGYLFKTTDASSPHVLLSSIHIQSADGEIGFMSVAGANSWFTVIHEETDLEPFEATLPSGELSRAIAGMEGEYTLGIGETSITVECETGLAKFQQNMGTVWPDYRAFFRFPIETTIELDQREFQEAVERVTYYTGPEGGVIIFGRSNSNTLYVETLNGREMQVPIRATIEGAETVNFAVNAKILLSVLKGHPSLEFNLRPTPNGFSIIEIADRKTSHYLSPLTARKRI